MLAHVKGRYNFLVKKFIWLSKNTHVITITIIVKASTIHAINITKTTTSTTSKPTLKMILTVRPICSLILRRLFTNKPIFYSFFLVFICHTMSVTCLVCSLNKDKG